MELSTIKKAPVDPDKSGHHYMQGPPPDPYLCSLVELCLNFVPKCIGSTNFTGPENLLSAQGIF